MCFNSLLIYYEIIYDSVVKKTPPPCSPPYERSGGKFPRSPASLLTAISNHSLAALSAKMFAFKIHKRQNAYHRNLKWTLEDLLPFYCYTTKTYSQSCPHGGALVGIAPQTKL